MAEQQENHEVKKEKHRQQNEEADKKRSAVGDKHRQERSKCTDRNDRGEQKNDGGQEAKQRQSSSRQWTKSRPQHQHDGGSSSNASFRRDAGGASGRSTPLNMQSQPNWGGGGNRGGTRSNNRQPSYQNRNVRQFGGGGKSEGTYKRMAKQRVDHAGVPMSGQVSDCLICCQHSDVYGIGECLHPICMECALRMRVGSESRQCPQCRAEISTLFFVSVAPGMQMAPRLPTKTFTHPDGQKIGVKFESNYVIDCFNAYMTNRCVKCTNRTEKVDFPTFAELRAHMSQVHQLSFCHICCDNLNVLTKDRRVYTREQLQRHMAGRLHGEEDGFRGHPTCQFCEQRFYDDEQQYRHLRKEHYFCQFCDQDGLEQNVFYRNQHQLNQHNRKEHHPCTDPDCLHVGIVFRTDTELEVHRAKQHRAGGGSRTIPLDIQFSRSGYTRGNGPSRAAVDGEREDEVSEAQPRPPPDTPVLNVRVIPSAFDPLRANNNFPCLPASIPPPTLPYGAPPGWSPSQQTPQLSTSKGAPKLSLQSREQFPILTGGSSSSAPQQQDSVWDQKSTSELFKNKPQKLEKKNEEPKRIKINPPPEIWPEGMREQLRARELGLPDPDPVVLPHWLDPPKKEKKKKSKTVPIAQMVANKIAAESAKLAVSSTKFNTLAELGNSIEGGSVTNEGGNKTEKTKKTQKMTTNCWGSDDGHVKLTPSESGDPGFMRIQLNSKLRLIGQTSKEEEELYKKVPDIPTVTTSKEESAELTPSSSSSKFNTLAELANAIGSGSNERM
uniref:RING-type domain-containing protein n=1 Tax=Globodera rostochiensis TaxID=31243 RepID=A0A914HUH5_GLORO